AADVIMPATRDDVTGIHTLRSGPVMPGRSAGLADLGDVRGARGQPGRGPDGRPLAVPAPPGRAAAYIFPETVAGWAVTVLRLPPSKRRRGVGRVAFEAGAQVDVVEPLRERDKDGKIKFKDHVALLVRDREGRPMPDVTHQVLTLTGTDVTASRQRQVALKNT